MRDDGVMTEQTTDETLHYTLYSVFSLDLVPSDEVAPAVEAALDGARAKGVTVRGVYDVAGYRADADIVFWLIGPDPDELQRTYQALRKALGDGATPIWSVMGLHRDAEFNRSHVPAFLSEEPRGYLCVYPFVRSLEWYILDPAERSAMLAEHGRMAASYKDVRANTVSSFGLGDYEWLLAFESDHPERIVDLLRDLRAAKARLHTREEVPFFFGPRRSASEVIAARR